MNLLYVYIFTMIWMWVVFSEKPSEFGAFFGQAIKWLLFLPLFMITISIFFFNRKKLKWLKSKWFLVGCGQFWKMMI